MFMQDKEKLYKTIITNCIILLREENTVYFNNEKLADEIGAPLSLIEEIDNELEIR